MESPRDFVEKYRSAWEQVMNRRSGIATMTPFFNIPCLMVGAEGAVTQYTTPQQVQSFNQSRLEAFNAGGATRARVLGCDAMTLGNHAALAVVNWELSRNDGSIERAWRHYYNLVQTADGWRILLSAFHAGS
jgi:hypothetical protein